MPIYQYELVQGDCKLCGGAFELRRPVDRPALEACPICKKPVRKCIGTINTPKLTRKPSVSEAKAAGFQVWQRRDKGTYERL